MTKHKITSHERAGADTVADRAAMFKALGEPTRLRIYEFLRACCRPVAVNETGDVRLVIGPTVGEVCCRVTGAERITSTVSEHLRELRDAGLITIERRGRNMICGIDRGAAQTLAEYLGDAGIVDAAGCCGDYEEIQSDGR